jgi:hypothetical protein
MPETLPRKKDANRIRDRINRSLDAAVEEAERVGYISADEGERRAAELLKKISKRVATGQIKP